MTNKVIHGDNLEVLKTYPDNFFHSVVTDPPYGLKFMNKHWDYDVPQVEFWQEVLRVLKPGGYVLSFGGTRTYHRMVVNIEDAGFIIRDQLQWIYGSGFPKSLNIGKAIDKLQGNEREVVGTEKIDIGMRSGSMHSGRSVNVIERNKTQGFTEWEGYGTALKPANEPICLAMKPLSEKNFAENVLKHGAGGLNIDASRVGTEEKISYGRTKEKAPAPNCYGKYEKRIGAEQNSKGRFPSNVILDEEAGGMLDKQSGVSISKSTVRKNKVNTGGNGIYNNYEAQDSFGFDGFGGASRFFMNIKKDIEDNFLCCYLCAKVIKKEKQCQKENKPAQPAEKNLKSTQATKEFIAQKNVINNLSKKLVQLVNNAENLCEECAMNFVQDLVLISESQKGVQSPKVLQAIRDFTVNYKNYILFQNLVYCVEQMGNIDITPITQSLLKLFGSVSLAIEDYIKKDTREAEALRYELIRFRYSAKASSSERNAGMRWDSERGHIYPQNNSVERKELNATACERVKNHHATVKPLSLMRYLVRLVTPKGGIVLEPFAGSGTTLLAAKKEGFEFVGIERELEYCKIAEQRLESVAINEKLF